MSRDGNIISFNVDKLVLYPMLTDPSGGSATYGSGVQLVGAQECDLKMEILSKELPGDGQIIDYYSKIRAISGKIVHGQLSMLALPSLLGGTNTDSGVSPNEVKQYDQPGNVQMPYFKIDAQVLYEGELANVGGDHHLLILKGKVKAFSWDPKDSDYALVNMEYFGVPRAADGKLFSILQEQTATAAVTAADTTPPTLSSIVPANNATGVALSTTVVWTFSESLQAGCINGDNFMLLDQTSEAAIAGTLVGSVNNTIVTFTPTSNLTVAHTFAAIATTGVKDLAGNRLAAQSVNKFQT